MLLNLLDKIRKSSARSPRYEKLRERRNALAKSLEIRPFRIVSNRTLEDLSKVLPRNMEELGLVPGVGPKTLEKYGEPILKWIKETT